MKQQDSNHPSDQNWNWPQKTWFQERLNAVKAREQQAQQKPQDPEISPAAKAPPQGKSRKKS
jgi:hypothetical protein